MTKCAFLLILFTSQIASATEIVGLKCFVDQMPSDGAKQEFILKNHSATYRESHYNRIEGKLVSSTQNMILEGECKFNAEKFVGSCRERLLLESGEEEMRFVDIKTVTETMFDFDDGTDQSFTRVLISYVNQPDDEGSEQFDYEFFRDDCSLIVE